MRAAKSTMTRRSSRLPSALEPATLVGRAASAWRRRAGKPQQAHDGAIRDVRGIARGSRTRATSGGARRAAVVLVVPTSTRCPGHAAFCASRRAAELRMRVAARLGRKLVAVRAGKASRSPIPTSRRRALTSRRTTDGRPLMRGHRIVAEVVARALGAYGPRSFPIRRRREGGNAAPGQECGKSGERLFADRSPRRTEHGASRAGTTHCSPSRLGGIPRETRGAEPFTRSSSHGLRWGFRRSSRTAAGNTTTRTAVARGGDSRAESRDGRRHGRTSFRS